MLKKYIKILLLLLIPLVLTIISEFIWKQDIMKVMNWMQDSNIQFITTYIIVTLIMVFFIGLFGKVYLSVILTSLLVVIFAFVQKMKIAILGEPFFPWDISLYKQIFNIGSFVKINVTVTLILSILVFILFFFLIYKIYKGTKIDIINRIVFVGIFFVGIGFMCLSNEQFKIFMDSRYKVDLNIYVPASHYDTNGFIFTFATNISKMKIDKPEGYSIDVAKELELNYSESKEIINTLNDESNTEVKPNIVIILSEAFTLPKDFPNVTYSTNPTPFFDKISETTTTGRAISPAFGGGTSNVEFEVLSGLATKFVPDGSNVYTRYIKKPIISIPSILKEKGYNSIAIHTYTKEFFRRNYVYQYLGIDEYIGLEDIENKEKAGYYVSDNQFADLIIQNYEKKKNQSDAPTFVLGVSMENHAPYSGDKYDNYNIEAYSDLLNEEENGKLKSYVQGAYDSDKSMEKLVNYFSTREEPVVLLVFGDHKPALNEKFGIYKKLGIVNSGATDEWNIEQTEFMYTVPYFIWSNYEQRKETPNLMSTHYLGKYLFDYIGMKGSSYFNFLDLMQNILPVNKDKLIIDAQGNKYIETPEEYKKYEKEQAILQYYYLFDE